MQVIDFIDQYKKVRTHALLRPRETLCGHMAGGFRWQEPRRGDRRSVTCRHCVRMGESPCQAGGHDFHEVAPGWNSYTCWICGAREPIGGPNV